MFEQAIRASEAMKAHEQVRRLFPAVAGCSACQTVRMIASPMPAPCADCGAEPDVLRSTELAVRDS